MLLLPSQQITQLVPILQRTRHSAAVYETHLFLLINEIEVGIWSKTAQGWLHSVFLEGLRDLHHTHTVKDMDEMLPCPDVAMPVAAELQQGELSPKSVLQAEVLLLKAPTCSSTAPEKWRTSEVGQGTSCRRASTRCCMHMSASSASSQRGTRIMFGRSPSTACAQTAPVTSVELNLCGKSISGSTRPQDKLGLCCL